MWRFNNDIQSWIKVTESLDKENHFNNLRQDLEKMWFYSKCLNGTSYLTINNLSNIYEKLDKSFKVNSTFMIDTTSSIYAPSASGDTSITTNNKDIFDNYLLEDVMSIKNLFTDKRTINDMLDNYIEVDIISTTELTDLNSKKVGLIIDNVRVLNGHKVLLKDQVSTITLSNAIDPDVYFNHSYSIIDESPTTITYSFYNNQNGIYIFQNDTLVKSDILDNYETCMNYSVVVKLGTDNIGKQFHLTRLKNGFYPLTSNNDPIEFIEKHNWVLRNQLEYQNIREITTYSSIYDSVNDRTVAVGDFGTIIFNQSGVSNIVKNKYKEDLYNITQTSNFYWIVGKNGTLLKVDNTLLNVEYINLNTFHSLKSISFFNESRGVIVGDYNTIYVTLDAGYTWRKIESDIFKDNMYTKCIFTDLNRFYIIGKSGIFIEFNLINNVWSATVRRPIKKEENLEEYFVYDNFTDIILVDTNTWNLPGTDVNKQFLVITSDNNNLIIYDRNDFYSDYDFLFLDIDDNLFNNTFGNIQSIVNINDNLYYISDNKGFYIDLNLFDTILNDSNIITTDPSNDLSDSNMDGNYTSLTTNINNEIIITGINATFKLYDFLSIPYDLDINFGDKYISKMLFLDYDIASKLNFFDSSNNYRLPNEISITESAQSSFIFSNLPNEKNWLNYNKDELKIFRYNEPMNIANLIEYSTEFITHTALQSNIIPITSVTSDENIIEDLLNLNTPSSLFDMYLYMNLMILNVDLSIYPIDEGDVLYIDNSVIKDARFIVNRIENISGNTYVYLYSNFNYTIINDLVSLSNFDIINLNKYNDLDIENTLVPNFNRHFISESYIMEMANSEIYIKGRYTNNSAYYNLQTLVDIDSTLYTMEYTNAFMDFGYSPTYNIYTYLNNIDNTIFDITKEFPILPIYINIPFGNAGVNVSSNKLIFNPSLEFEYNSFFINTFINVSITDTIDIDDTERVLILNKYYDEVNDRYIIELSKSILNTILTPTSISISSRRMLTEISDDLMLMNNIQRSETVFEYGSSNYTNYVNELNFKFSTENYFKALICDKDIRELLTSIIYIDNKNQLSMNILNLGEIFNPDIVDLYEIGNLVTIEYNTPHMLNVGDYIKINDLNNYYTGIHIVTNIVNNTTVTLDTTYILPSPVIDLDLISTTIYIYDENLNYTPVDIIDVGIDKRGKISVAIKYDNVIENMDETVSLVNLDLTMYKFKLLDGLTVMELEQRFPWVLEAELENAIIGLENNEIVFYSGIWHCGRWFGSNWYSGIWRSGQWYKGTFNSLLVDINPIKATVNFKTSDTNYSKWYNGDFRGGVWNNGSWFNGNFYSGIWNNGYWVNGTFHTGTWNNGQFTGGVWLSGEWFNGIFNRDNNYAVWVDGTWSGGDFENGLWLNGFFKEKDVISRFGTKSSFSKKSIWKSGKWFNGEFHSSLDNDRHDISIWETGIWNYGKWFGGTAYNIDFNGGKWYSGVSNFIEVVGMTHSGVDSSRDNTILVRGKWEFNRNDTFSIIDNKLNIHPLLGENDNSKEYIVKNINILEDDNLTEIIVFQDLTTIPGFGYSMNIPVPLSIPTNFVVSNFEKADWDSGLWLNGIFNGSLFNSGLWVNGIFKGGDFS